MPTVNSSIRALFNTYGSAERAFSTPFGVYGHVGSSLSIKHNVFTDAKSPALKTPFHVYSGPRASVKCRFHVFSDITVKKNFPNGLSLPKPGQWVLIDSQLFGVNQVFVKVTNVSIKLLLNDLYQVTVQANRVALKEDILFAKLARQQISLIQNDVETTEPLELIDYLTRIETLDIRVLDQGPAYSGVNYSGNEYSGA